MIIVYLGASLISLSSYGFPLSCFDVKLMKERVEQNFSCSSQSLIKQIFAATSYSKIADVSSSLAARTLTDIIQICVSCCSFVRRMIWKYEKIGETHQKTTRFITFRNTENSYNMNTRITVGARTFFIILVKIVPERNRTSASRLWVLPRPRHEPRWLKGV